jgi:hypothetical protein
MAVPELGQQAAKQRVQEATAAQDVPKMLPARFAFLVYVTPEGETVMTPDLNAPVAPERIPSTDEVKGACGNVLNHLNSQEVIMGATQMILMNLQRIGQARAVSQDPTIQQALSKIRA